MSEFPHQFFKLKNSPSYLCFPIKNSSYLPSLCDSNFFSSFGIDFYFIFLNCSTLSLGFLPSIIRLCLWVKSFVRHLRQKISHFYYAITLYTNFNEAVLIISIFCNSCRKSCRKFFCRNDRDSVNEWFT